MRLGVGKNMVRAIRFWGLAAKVVVEVPDPDARSGRKPTIVMPTRFGETLFGEAGWDPWMEDPASLWLLHWRLLARPCRLPVWWLALCDFNAVEFEVEDLGRSVMTQLRSVPDWKEPSESAVEKDLSAFMRTYGPTSRTGRETVDDAQMPIARTAPGRSVEAPVPTLQAGSEATSAFCGCAHAVLDWMHHRLDRPDGGTLNRIVAERLASERVQVECPIVQP